MDTSSPPLPSPEFSAIFRAEAGVGGILPFARFMELALYHPKVGYYRRARERVGRRPDTDFFTSTSLGPLFGELVCAACVKLLGEKAPADHTFVEIGAEPGRGVLDGVSHPFKGVRTLRLGEPIKLGGSCVVFSNELFDAQPCVSLVFREGRWHEIGVRIEDNRFVEVELPAADRGPSTEGYRLDEPRAAAELAATIARQPWHGLFVAFDYGKTFRELRENTPGGTVRAYHHHTQSNAVLERPGEQDLTCHVCWDWLSEALVRADFTSPALEFQETFLLRHATTTIAAICEAEAPRLSQRKLALQQLLHPSRMGQKFQVLHARRPSEASPTA